MRYKLPATANLMANNGSNNKYEHIWRSISNQIPYNASNARNVRNGFKHIKNNVFEKNSLNN